MDSQSRIVPISGLLALDSLESLCLTSSELHLNSLDRRLTTGPLAQSDRVAVAARLAGFHGWVCVL